MKKQGETNGKAKLTLFSEYGYIEVEKEEYEDKANQQLKFNKSNKNIEGRISRSTVTESIVVNLKTLYGNRRVYSFDVSIKDKIKVVIDRVVEEELKNNDKIKWNINYQYRLISTNGIIKEINPELSFAEEDIKNNFTIILATPNKLYFSETMKHQGIYLEDLNTVAHNMSGAEEHLLVLCDRGYKTGKNYIEFTLLTEPCQNSTILGVTHKRSDYYFYMDDQKNFWGFVPSEGSKLGNNDNVEIGIPCKINDRVGLLMDFHKGGMDLKLFINDLEICNLFKNLPLGHQYFPCAILKFDGMKVKVNNRVPIPLSSE